MARIAGITLPNDKQVSASLTSIHGIGRHTSYAIVAAANIGPLVKVRDLSEEQVQSLRQIIEAKYRVEGELRREVVGNIKRLKDIGCYRGIRHAKRLPVRGQRTKTNSRTVRGNVRRTMGSGKRTLEKT